MKHNTLRDYMGGGRNMPISYQQGGSGARKILGRARLSRKGMELEDKLADLTSKATSARDRILGFGKAGTGLLTLLAPRIIDAVLPGAGLLTTALAKGALSGIGRFAGEKLGGATAEKVDAGEGTGFGTEAKQDIEDYRESLGEGSAKRALGAGAGTALMSGVGDFAKAKIFGGGDKVMVRGADGKLTEQAIPQADIEGFNKAFEQSGALDMPGGTGGVRLGLSEAPGDSMEGMLGDVAVPELNLELDDFSNLPSAPPPSLGGSLEELLNQGQMPLPGQSGFAPGSGVNLPTQALDELSFGEAFNQARRGGLDEFMFEGMPYNTRLASPAMKGGMMYNYAKGGQLKQVPEGNRGLAKLPQAVRNKMGYMMQGGMMDDYMGGGMMDDYMGGGMMDMYMHGGMHKKKNYNYMGGGMTMGRGLIDMMPFKRRIV
jgi:hypothetical protein